MGISEKSEPCKVITCDKCGKFFLDENNGVACLNDDMIMELFADYDDWVQTDDGKILCEKCKGKTDTALKENE